MTLHKSTHVVGTISLVATLLLVILLIITVVDPTLVGGHK